MRLFDRQFTRIEGVGAPALVRRHVHVTQFSFFGSAMALILAACGTAPFDAPIDDRTGYPTVHQVVDKIQCEIAAARDDKLINSDWITKHLSEKNPPLMPFKNWVASVTVSLTVSDTEGISPASGLGLAVIDPLKLAGNSFGFGGNVIFYQNRQRIFSEQYSLEIAKIDSLDCAKINWHPFNLEGDLGLRDQIYAGLHSIVRDEAGDFDTSKNGTSADNFGATISFDVFKGLSSVGPTFTLTKFKGPTGGVGIQRDDMHKIVITFQPIAKGQPITSAKTNAKNTNDMQALRSGLHDIAQILARP
jgi:hypothetical protein